MSKEQFVKLPREVLESEAFGSLGINGFRVLRFLMIEHMRRGGKKNGMLVAPRRQLCAAGINNGERATEAIKEAEHLGLIDIERGDRRRPNRYALTWLPLYDGSAPSNRWREYRKVMRDNPPSGVGDNPPSKEGFMRDNPPSKAPKACRDNPPSLYRSSYQGGDISKEEEGYSSEAETVGSVLGEEPAASPGLPAGKPDLDLDLDLAVDPSRRCGWYVTNSVGFRVCGKPALAGADCCAEHARPSLPEGLSVGKPNGRAAP